MNVSEALDTLHLYKHAVVVTVDEDGYPFSVATNFSLVGKSIELSRPSTGSVRFAPSQPAQLIFSKIRPQPGAGYDQRSYVELNGTLDTIGDTWVFSPDKARGWDENTLPFFELAERAIPQARRYLSQLSSERGQPVKPQMSPGWKFFVATRLPFLTATIVPVSLGVATAAYDGHFSFWLMLLTFVGAISVHLGLNVANDIFDAKSGADEVNVNPTMFSGGSRVIQYGLLSLREMYLISGTAYALAIAIGLVLVWKSGLGLLWLGLAGVLISWFYTAPPFKLVHRGLGELAVALGFGPIMVLGAYYVQTGYYAWRPAILSIPVAVFVMLILYANEIPDRIADARVGKNTLVVRLSPSAVLNGYIVSAAVAYAVLVGGTIAGLIPWPGLIALLTIPLAVQVARGLKAHYDSPYQVMPSLQSNVLLHLAFGVLLVAGVLVGNAIK